MRFILILTFLISSSAQASLFNKYIQYRNDQPKYIWGSLGFWRGGNVFQGEFERMYDEDFGIGGFLAAHGGKSTTKSAVSLGAYLRPHIVKKSWDFYISPGFALTSTDGDTLLSPTFSTGVMFAVNHTISVGAELRSMHGLSNDKYLGPFINDFLFKFRYSPKAK